MAVSMKPAKDGSLLHQAASTNSVELLQHFLGFGLNVNSVNKRGYTPLHIAAWFGFDAGVTLLLDAGADVHSRSVKGDTPLHCAAWNGSSIAQSSIFEKLIAHGADVNCQNKSGYTVFHVAVFAMFETIWNKKALFIDPVLLKNEAANVNIKDVRGNTPLHYAVKVGNIQTVNELLSLGASIYSINNRGQTPLHYAALGNRILIVRALLKQGSEVNVKDRYGRTPLYLAVNDGNSMTCKQIVKELLEWGGSLLTKDGNQDKLLDSSVNSFVENHAFKMHSIKANCIKFTLDPIKQLDFLEYKPYNNFYISCLDEIKRMKERKFDQNLLIDVFWKFNDPTYLSNTKLKVAVCSEMLTDKFPIYASFLRATFYRAKKRSLLLENAYNRLTDILPLVPEVVRYILSYVTDDDLHNVVKAFEIEMLSSQNQAYLEVPV